MMMELMDYSWPCTHDHFCGPLKTVQGVDRDKSLVNHRQGKFPAPLYCLSISRKEFIYLFPNAILGLSSISILLTLFNLSSEVLQDLEIISVN